MDKFQRKYYRQIYLSRINKVMDYIDRRLSDPLNLTELADVASFSRFHFHRIFSAFTGETLNNYIRRKRLERAASYLKDNTPHSISEIGYMCGFSSQASFARSFREYFNMSPSEFRDGGFEQFSKNRKKESKISQTERKIGKPLTEGEAYFSGEFIHHQKRRLKMNVEIKEMPEMHVAYCRHTGPYHGIGKAIGKLMAWAAPRGLIDFPETKMLSVYHDDPDITDENRLQSSACITVPEGTKTEGGIGSMVVEGGAFAVAHFEITEDKFGEAWDAIMRDWLPESGYQCDDRPHYELYLNNAEEHPEKKHIVDICIPVKPL